MQKWEYLIFESAGDASFTPKVFKVNGITKQLTSFYDYLGELGEQGWELVAVRNDFHYFKRPINKKEQPLRKG